MESSATYPLEQDRKRYADDETVKELVRLRVQNNEYRQTLELVILYWDKWKDSDNFLALSLEEVVDAVRLTLAEKGNP